MKTTLISLSFASLVGLAILANGSVIGAAELTSGLFAIGLTAWTFRQYVRRPVPIAIDRAVQLPFKLAVNHREPKPEQLLAA